MREVNRCFSSFHLPSSMLLTLSALTLSSLLLMAEETNAPQQYKGRHVEVKGRPGSFQLLVDGNPYFVKGVGFNVDSLANAEAELKLAKETGFNSLRFWGAAAGRSCRTGPG